MNCHDEDLFKYFVAMTNEMYYTECFQQDEILGEVYVTFSRQPTPESKFLYTYNLLKKYDRLPIPALYKCGNTQAKSNKKAKNLRSKGNVRFQNCDYPKAYCDYNQSVLTANINSPDYALALANRSASLYYLEEYEFCIVSIHQALASDYPKDMAYKLCHREIKCLVKLGKISQAKSKLDELPFYLARTALSKDQKKTIKNEAKTLLTRSCKKANHKDAEEEEKIVIKLLGGSNKNIPSLSKFVQLKYSESMGRCLVVSTDIKPGDVLVIEKPYAGIARLESMECNCRYCFKLCLSGVPCNTCSMVTYCDETCRLKSFENGHKYECPILSKFYNFPCMSHMEHLSLYIVLTTLVNYGLEKYIATVRALNADDTDPIMRGFNTEGKYLSNQFCSVYKLEGNESKRTVSDLFLRYCYAAVLVSLLRMEIDIPDDQLGIVGESVIHIVCVVASNGHGITQPPMRKSMCLYEKEFMPVASLLMPVLSLLNHNCDPNVVRHNYNGTIVVRAIQPIPKGSQLFDNYGKLFAVHTKHERKQLLSNQYCFQCNCQACEEDWPEYSVLQGQPLTQRVLLTDLKPAQMTQFGLDSSKLDTIINEIKAKKTDGLKHLKFLYSYLEFLHYNVKKPWSEYCDCQETIKEVLYKTADKFMIKDC